MRLKTRSTEVDRTWLHVLSRTPDPQAVTFTEADRCLECSHTPIPERQNEYDCSYCNLQTIPKFPSSATKINLSFNNILSIGGRNFTEILNLRKLNLGNNILSVIEKGSFSLLKFLHVLFLNRNRLNCSSLKGLDYLQNLVYLDIRENIYGNYPVSITFLLKLNVLKIDIFRNFHFNDSFLSLKNLKEISFEPRGMVTLRNHSFEGIRNSPIKKLSLLLANRVAGEIGIDFLRPFKSLKNLSLNLSGRFDIKDVLKVLYGIRSRKLDCIDISENFWSIFRYHHLTIDDVGNLYTICVKEINLRRNNILYFPFQKSLDYINRNFSNCLEKLIISHNPIILKTSDLSSLFYYPSLKYTDISFSKQFSHQTFLMTDSKKDIEFYFNLNYTVGSPKNLEYIDISGNSLSWNPLADQILGLSSGFINAPNLKTIIAKDTSLTLCKYNVTFQRSLLVLDMTGWECSNMNPQFIQQHRDLTVLSASRSKLGKQLTKGGRLQSLFHGLFKLETSDFSFNDIEHLSDDFFIYQSDSLTNVNLNYNNFKQIPKALTVLNRANIIDFSFNKFTNITESDFNIMKSLRNSTFDFEGNKFECTCDFIDSLVWMNQSQNIRRNTRCRDGRDMNIILKDIHNFQLQCVSGIWLSFSVTTLLIFILVIVILALGYMNKSFVIYLFIKTRRLMKRDKMDSMMIHYKYDAFVSYSHLDYDWVTGHLFTYLTKKLCLKVCLHQKDFIPGNPIAEEILRCVECSRKSIFIITRNFLASKWSLFEMDIARHHVLQSDSDTLIIILKEDIPVHEMPPLLRKIWWRIVCLKYPKAETQFELDMFNSKLSEVFQS